MFTDNELMENYNPEFSEKGIKLKLTKRASYTISADTEGVTYKGLVAAS